MEEWHQFQSGRKAWCAADLIILVYSFDCKCSTVTISESQMTLSKVQLWNTNSCLEKVKVASLTLDKHTEYIKELHLYTWLALGACGLYCLLLLDKEILHQVVIQYTRRGRDHSFAVMTYILLSSSLSLPDSWLPPLLCYWLKHSLTPVHMGQGHHWGYQTECLWMCRSKMYYPSQFCSYIWCMLKLLHLEGQ